MRQCIDRRLRDALKKNKMKKRNIDYVIKTDCFKNIPRWQEKVPFEGVFNLRGPLQNFNMAFFFFFLAGTFIYPPYLISFS